MSLFLKNYTILAEKCSTTPVGPVHSSPASLWDARQYGDNFVQLRGVRTYIQRKLNIIISEGVTMFC